ncbi:MAG TPA: hypothetical protein VFN65_15970 [Solirubrobacteraceae bacterium]|nr:hypothetical protein [Solirubrobacteraceae bacterium]
MRSLRRDLFERRLWPLAVALVAVIAAVPFLLHGRIAGAPVPPPPPPSAAGAPGVVGSRQDAIDTRRPTAPTSHTRDPFQPTATPSALHLTRTSPHTTRTASTAPTPHPAPVVHRSPATPPATTPTPTPSAPSTPVLSSPPAVTKPTATRQLAPRKHHAAPRRSWDIYSVDIRIGRWGRLATHRDPARLTPLPYERAPQVMYLGVTDHGRRAVFALGAGVEVRADGKRRSLAPACSPSRLDCALVIVPAGERVRLRYVSATGAQRTLILVVRRITTRLTRSAAAARAARDHISGVGLCELRLGDPIGFFDPAAASVKLPSTASCRRDRRAVAFPGSLGAGSSVRG